MLVAGSLATKFSRAGLAVDPVPVIVHMLIAIPLAIEVVIAGCTFGHLEVVSAKLWDMVMRDVK